MRWRRVGRTQETAHGQRPCHRLSTLAAGLLVLCACTPGVEQLDDPPHAAVFTTTGAWHSMVYAARVETGVILVDLGWFGGEALLDEALEELRATREDVTGVLLTHSHRDHIGLWRLVTHATFYVHEAELPFLYGEASHQDIGSRVADTLVAYPRPRRGEVRTVSFGQDTVITFGRDSVYAFPVPGHTAGSTAYLFRGTLFVGDALAHSPLVGFHPARPLYTADLDESRASLRSLFERLQDREIEIVCNAHGKCAAPSEGFRDAVLR